MATDNNLSHFLSNVNKKLKWNGDIDQLKEFVRKRLSLHGNWSSPDENTEKLTSQTVFITFYKSTGTLLIQGKEPGKTKLIKLLWEIASEKEITSGKGNTSSETESTTTDENGNNCNEEECHQIYVDVGHIKQRVGDERFLGSKGQFCAAFYHVHEWGYGQRQHYCLDETNCIIAKRVSANNNNWSLQALNVVAVVKFEDENEKILYEARYTNCGKEQKHAEDFFKDDIENGELGGKVQANPNGTITLYLTYQPCNKSTRTGNTPEEKTCCETLTTVRGILPPEITLCVKAANTRRLSQTKATGINEILRKNAVDGITMLMQVEGVNVSGMTPGDWGYLLSLTEDFESRHDLDKSVQNILDEIQDYINQDKIYQAEIGLLKIGFDSI